MKKLLHEVTDKTGEVYQLFAELKECTIPENTKHLTFYSVYTGAKNSKSEQRKCEFMLGPDSLNNLKELLGAK